MEGVLIVLIVIGVIVAIGGFLYWQRTQGQPKAEIGMETLSGAEPLPAVGTTQPDRPALSQAEFLNSTDMATLEIVEGPSAIVHNQNMGNQVSINQKRVTIGRNPRQVDIQLYNLDEPSSVSRLHCSIEFYPTIQCFMITDEGSSSGTRVGGQTIAPYQPHSLRNGDVIELGIVDKLGAVLHFHTTFNPPDSGGRLRVDAGIQAKDTIRQAVEHAHQSPARGVTQPLKSDIFISYSRKDRDVMRVVRDSLSAHKFIVWSDEKLEPSSPSWRGDVQNAIENTKCVVAIMSPDSKNSEWVNEELNYAKICKARIFTVLVRGDESNAVPFGMSGVQWIDMRTDYAEGIQEIVYETATTQLAASIGEFLGRA
jgi:pSer/pThr/pTyr-binding forkhead associated (FHA) protein